MRQVKKAKSTQPTWRWSLRSPGVFVHLYEGFDQPEVLGPGPVTHPVLDRWVNEYLNENLFKLLPNIRGLNSSRTKEHL